MFSICPPLMPSSSLEPQTLSLRVFVTAHLCTPCTPCDPLACNGAGYSRFRASDLTPRSSGNYTARGPTRPSG
jgi:hypothetical protein